jgi:hypothetical protein
MSLQTSDIKLLMELVDYQGWQASQAVFPGQVIIILKSPTGRVYDADTAVTLYKRARKPRFALGRALRAVFSFLRAEIRQMETFFWRMSFERAFHKAGEVKK